MKLMVPIMPFFAPLVQGLVAAILINTLFTALLVNMIDCQSWSLDKRAD